MPAEKPYRRLPGRGRGLGVYTELWEGADHLLHVETNGYTENYKRFYYRDIQAVVMQRNRHRSIGNFLLGLAGAIAAVPAVVYGPGAGSLIAPSFFLIFLIANSLLGPCCTVRVVTPVNDQRLPNIRRTRVFRKFMGRLDPHIREAQGVLAPEQIAQPPEVLPARATTSLRIKRRVAEGESTKPARRICHGAAAAGFAVFGALALIKLSVGHWMLFFSACLVFCITFVFVVIALVLQSRGRIDPALKRWTWYALAFQVGGALVSYIMVIVIAASGVNGADLTTSVVTGTPAGQPAMMVIHLALAIFSLSLAALGGLLARRAPEPPAPPPILRPPPLAPPAAPAAPPPLPSAGDS